VYAHLRHSLALKACSDHYAPIVETAAPTRAVASFIGAPVDTAGPSEPSHKFTATNSAKEHEHVHARTRTVAYVQLAASSRIRDQSSVTYSEALNMHTALQSVQTAFVCSFRILLQTVT
jgi:hypothetical protein